MDQPVAEPQTLVVPAGQPPTRLDVFLVRHADLSRMKIQAAIKDGRVKLNGRSTKPHHLVHPGDEVIVEHIAAQLHVEAKVVNLVSPTVLMEDEHYLVVNKPAGLIVHGGPGIHQATLADWAIAHDPAIAQVGDQPDLRPGIVHRLDREVSGVMVIAKTQEAFLHLKRQFQDHTVTKEYLALAHGRISDESGRITFAIARKPDHSGLMVARPQSTEGKEAETRFTVERYVKGMTLVRVRTLTGRMHQIRVHFKAIHHPLVGDPLYKIRRLKVEKLPSPRLFLHADLLVFNDLHGQPRRITAPLPADLAQFLARAG